MTVEYFAVMAVKSDPKMTMLPASCVRWVFVLTKSVVNILLVYFTNVLQNKVQTICTRKD